MDPGTSAAVAAGFASLASMVAAFFGYLTSTGRATRKLEKENDRLRALVYKHGGDPDEHEH